MKTFRLPLILIFLILTGIAFRFLTPRSTPSPSPSPQTPSKPSTILPQPNLTTLFSSPSSITSTLNLPNLPQFPTSLPIYTLTSFPADWHNQLAASLSFTAPPTTYGQLQIWSQNNRSLLINTKTLAVSYTQPLSPTLPNLNRTTIETAIQPLLQKLPTSQLWDTTSITIDYFSPPTQGNENLISSNATSATIAKINLTPQINNLPLFAANPSIGLLQITLDTNNQTLSLSTQLATANFQPDQTYPLISSSEALNQLNQQKATVVHLQPVGKTYLDKISAYAPQNTQINHISLAYLFDVHQPTQPLQPIYVFSGQTILENGQSAAITLYLPAVNPKYLLSPSPSPTSPPFPIQPLNP